MKKTSSNLSNWAREIPYFQFVISVADNGFGSILSLMENKIIMKDNDCVKWLSLVSFTIITMACFHSIISFCLSPHPKK